MKFHQKGFDKTINLSIHYTVYVRRLKVCSMIFNTSVIKHITANLASPLNFLLACLYFSLLGLALFQSPVFSITAWL